MKNFLFVLACLFPFSIYSQQKKEVLFLGNSYTYSNDLPGMLSTFALNFGDTLVYDSNTPGGYTLQGHSTDATSISKINSKPWDYVILQEQSQRPAFSPSQVATEVYPYADSLHRMIKANDSCTKVLFFMTWGRKNGDASNCAFYPPVCTYNGMQARLRESYLYMGMNYGEVSPVGAAWKFVRDSFPAIELYTPDESHPSANGTYLAACVFYASIFHASPKGGYIPAGIDSTFAMQMQNSAHQVVLDSLSNWFIDTSSVVADFSYSFPGGPGDVQFTDLSSGATTYSWNFGDGMTSTLASPLHNYDTSGTYWVTLIATRNCISDTLTDSVNVTITSIENAAIQKTCWVFPNPAKEYLYFHSEDETLGDYKVLDATGKVILNGKLQGVETRISIAHLRAGVYFLESNHIFFKILVVE